MNELSRSMLLVEFNDQRLDLEGSRRNKNRTTVLEHDFEGLEDPGVPIR